MRNYKVHLQVLVVDIVMAMMNIMIMYKDDETGVGGTMHIV